MSRVRFYPALVLFLVPVVLTSCGSQGSPEAVARQWVTVMAAGNCERAEALMSPDSGGLLKANESGVCAQQYQGCMTRGGFWLGRAKIDNTVVREYSILGRPFKEVTLMGDFLTSIMCLESQEETLIRVSVEQLDGQWYVLGVR